MKTRRIAPLALAALVVLAAAGLTGCAPTPATKAVAVAKAQIGATYRSGGDSPSEGFDCSGLTSYAWGQAGYSLPRGADDQYVATTRVTRANLKPGDLVFYSSAGTTGHVSHVALYVGDGKIVQARKPGVPASQDDLATFWKGHLVGYGRVKESAKRS